MGTGPPQPLTESDRQQSPWPFTPDGKRLAFVEISGPTKAVIWTAPVETERGGLRAGKPEIFLQTPSAVRCPTIRRPTAIASSPSWRQTSP